VGEPVITDATIQNHKSGGYVATQCFDEREWTGEIDGREISAPTDGAHRRVDLLVEQFDEDWFITDMIDGDGPDPCG
jgi:hypothetical protein